jgi:O-acetyl-ADP-ribose deacetylase (regulator of RNase III)
MWHGGLHGEAETLAECYRSCLAVAREMKLTSISFPSISTGAYGFPIEKAAPIALSTVKEVLAQLRASGAGDEVPLKEVRFVLFSDRDLEFYTSQMGNSPQ